jgi:hypothetical protein
MYSPEGGELVDYSYLKKLKQPFRGRTYTTIKSSTSTQVLPRGGHVGKANLTTS